MTMIKVPEGMLKAALERWPLHGDEDHRTLDRLEAALQWLSENPIVPTSEQSEELAERSGISTGNVQYALSLWQRRMFLAPEPEIYSGVKDFAFLRDVVAFDATDGQKDFRVLLPGESQHRGHQAYRQVYGFNQPNTSHPNTPPATR